MINCVVAPEAELALCGRADARRTALNASREGAHPQFQLPAEAALGDPRKLATHDVISMIGPVMRSYSRGASEA